MPDRLVLSTDGFWISPYVFSCFVAMREKGLAFETVTVPLQDGAQRKPEYRDRTLTARVPALDHDDFTVAESSAILEYLEETFPPPAYPAIFPADVRGRARARQVVSWIRSDLMPVREERSTHTMFYERATAPLSDAGRRAAEKLLRVSEALVPAGGGPLFGAWSIADSDLAFMLHRLILAGDDVPARVRDWAAAEWKRPSVKEFCDRPRPPYVAY